MRVALNYANYSDYRETIAQWLGSDAAGAALTDNNSCSWFSMTADGFIHVSQSGAYTFALVPSREWLELKLA